MTQGANQNYGEILSIELNEGGDGVSRVDFDNIKPCLFVWGAGVQTADTVNSTVLYYSSSSTLLHIHYAYLAAEP